MSDKRCPVCNRPASKPYRVYDARYKIASGCVADFHTNYLIPGSASMNWHNRRESCEIRAAMKKWQMMKTRQNPIKGPGKYEGELYATRYAHENPDDELGDVQDFGWFGRFSGKIKGRGPFHIITQEDNNGFVYGKFYETESELNDAWDDIETEYAEFGEGEDND